MRSEVERALQEQAAVGLLGPRQVGKTTLALQIGEPLGAVYLDLENPSDRAKLSDPAAYLRLHSERLVILDEIHRIPDLFPVLRGLIDEGRRSGKGTGRFLLLGSASIDLLGQSSESLAGRISYLQLGPIHPLEFFEPIDSLWLRGGFPDSLLARSDQSSFVWRQNFIRTYLERDVSLFGPRIPAPALERLWTMLAHRQGSILNTSDLARSLDVSPTTVVRYLDLLDDLLLVRRLPPFASNLGKRLVKSPKVYVRDSGIVHALLGLGTMEQLVGHPASGLSWEGMVVEAIHQVLPWRTRTSHYRTATGVEMDLVLEFADGRVWAIEVKRSVSTVTKGFRQAIEDLQPERTYVVHAGEETYPFGHGVEATSVRDLCRRLLQSS